jgi:hypothetical protein
MIHGRKNKEVLTEEQSRVRNKELIGLPLTEEEIQTISYEDEVEEEDEDVVDLEKIIQDLQNEIMLDEILEEMMGDSSNDEDSDEEVIDVSDLDLDEDEMKELIYQVLTDKENEKNLSEQHNIKFDGIELKGGFGGGNSNTLVYRPISSKMSDKIEDMEIPREKIIKKIISFLQKKYRGLKFDEDYSYQGYGYPIRLDMWSFN